MSARHTPGPWAIQHQEGHPYIVADQGKSWKNPLVCSLYEDVTPSDSVTIGPWLEANENAEANARLIAAAPDLLAALKLVMQCAGDIASAPDGLLEMALDDGDEETRRQANAFLVARAAIAKATGDA